MAMIRVVAMVILCSSLVSMKTVFPSPWLVEDIPNPQKDVYACGRKGKKSFVCDPDGVLTFLQADMLDRMIEKTCNDTKCICPNGCKKFCNGYSISVALVDKFNLEMIRTPEHMAAHWANTLRSAMWRFGSCEDAVVVVASRQDGQIYSSVGEWIEVVLAPECVEKTFGEIEGLLNSGAIDQAVLQMVDTYKSTLLGVSCDAGLSQREKISVGICLVLGVIILIGMAKCVQQEVAKSGAKKSKSESTSSLTKLTNFTNTIYGRPKRGRRAFQARPGGSQVHDNLAYKDKTASIETIDSVMEKNSRNIKNGRKINGKEGTNGNSRHIGLDEYM